MLKKGEPKGIQCIFWKWPYFRWRYSWIVCRLDRGIWEDIHSIWIEHAKTLWIWTTYYSSYIWTSSRSCERFDDVSLISVCSGTKESRAAAGLVFTWESSQVRRSPMKIIARTWNITTTGAGMHQKTMHNSYYRWWWCILGKSERWEHSGSYG